MWIKNNGTSEFPYSWSWQLHPGRQEDRLLVFPVGEGAHRAWYGEIILDRERILHARCGPFLTPEEGMQRIGIAAAEWTATIAFGAFTAGIDVPHVGPIEGVVIKNAESADEGSPLPGGEP